MLVTRNDEVLNYKMKGITHIQIKTSLGKVQISKHDDVWKTRGLGNTKCEN